jgi:hypothetical protein
MKKNNVFLAGMAALALTFVMTAAGCTTTKSLSRLNPVGGEYQNIKVPNKDFTAMGVVLAEYTAEGDGAGGEWGEVYTYQKLLKEAKQLGADAIVNVVIEGILEAQTEKLFGLKTKQGMTKTTWLGSATAIKYTDSLNITDKKTVVVLGPDGKQIITEGSSAVNTPLADNVSGASPGSKKVWWNPFTWFKK